MLGKQWLGFLVVLLFSPWLNMIGKVDFTDQSNGFCLPKDLNENSGILQTRY